MSSKFFARISDTESESEESEEEILQNKAPAAQPTYISDDEDDQAKRVVRTAKEKRYEELDEIIKQIRNYKKIKDIAKIQTGFDNLTKAFTKAKPVIEKADKGVTPKFYIRCIVEIEDFLNAVWEDKDFRKNMNKINSKALASLRQKIRKYNKDFEEDILKYRENPVEEEEEAAEDESESEDDSDEESSDDDDVPKAKPSKASAFTKDAKTKVDDDDDSDDSYWGSGSDETDSDSDDGEEVRMADYFLKDKDTAEKEPKKKDRKERSKTGKVKVEDDDDEGGEWQKVRDGAIVQEKPKLFGKDEEVNHVSMLTKINEILAMRGKKRIHRSDQVELLSELLELAQLHKLGPAMEVRLNLGIIGGLLDYNTNITVCMRVETWKKCHVICNQLLDMLNANPDIVIGEKIAEETESFEKAPFRVSGCALTLVERIDEEFTKMLQSVDAHSPDYIERLKDEKDVYDLILRMETYLLANQRGTTVELCRVYILRIDHLYYKFDAVALANKKPRGTSQILVNGYKPEVATEAKEEATEEQVVKETSLDTMDRLCKYIYANDKTDRIRTQAVLYHIYHQALHDNWFEARDLMLMSHLQQNIIKADIPLQVIYNRALVQLGLCAFRHGNIRDAHTALLDIQILGRAKELLAQGLLPKQQERTPEQEKLEKRRLLPFHKHVNLELLECVYLVSAMLLEIPDVAANEYSIRKKMISRSFYNQLRKNEEQPLVGLPESMREHVVAASKQMRVGNWKSCRDFIINEKMNNKVWNLFHQPDKVREMLVQKIREESLRAYLFTYSHVYNSISLDTLSQMLDLEKAVVHSIISKMTTNEELMTSLDEPTQTLVMHRTEPSRIQGLALQMADKINILVEQNERLWELKQMGTFGATERRERGDRRDRGDRGDGEERQHHGGGYHGGHRGSKNWADRLGYDGGRRDNRQRRFRNRDREQ
ncbi:Eukaryotic translation initiation factor 3 subunit C [Halotydeus destructor]|nr:Eukaryotic translation initiation factor 3 subunit C [Halotydeus destructor]